MNSSEEEKERERRQQSGVDGDAQMERRDARAARIESEDEAAAEQGGEIDSPQSRKPGQDRRR